MSSFSDRSKISTEKTLNPRSFNNLKNLSNQYKMNFKIENILKFIFILKFKVEFKFQKLSRDLDAIFRRFP